MRLSRPIMIWATTSIHSRGVSPWLMPRSNRSTCSGICANSGSSASFRISSRATSASRKSTTTPVRSAASIRAWRSASRRRMGRGLLTALLPEFCASDIPWRPLSLRVLHPLNLSVTVPRAKSRLFPKAYAFGRPATWFRIRREGPHPGLPREEREGEDVSGPTRKSEWDRFRPWTFLSLQPDRSGRNARGLFHDGKTHAGFVAVFFRDHAPGLLGFFAGLERALHLGGAFHELVEVHRTELAANHPEIAACGHDRLLLRCLNVDVRTMRLELRGFCRVVQRSCR